MKFFSEVRNLAAKHGRVCVQASRALEATSKQDGQGRQSTRWSRPTVKVGSGNPLLLRLAMVEPAKPAVRASPPRVVGRNGGGGGKRKSVLANCRPARVLVPAATNISHGLANGTLVGGKKCAGPEKPGCGHHLLTVVYLRWSARY